jgi:hypothetical protein
MENSGLGLASVMIDEEMQVRLSSNWITEHLHAGAKKVEGGHCCSWIASDLTYWINVY